MAETEKGSDDQMTPEQRAKVEDQERAAVAAADAEDELTEAQPDDGPG